MKLTKMAGAFALTAALAMSAVPAFAAVEATNEDYFVETNTTNTNQAQATTEVWAQTINKYLNATIPTRVAIVVPSQGGAITAPSTSAYKIHSNTDNDIYLTKVNSRPGGAFQLSALATNATGLPNTVTNHTFALTLDAGTWTGIPLDGNEKVDSSATIPANGDLGLQLAGQFMPANANTGGVLSASQLNSAVMNIVYTIATDKSHH